MLSESDTQRVRDEAAQMWSAWLDYGMREGLEVTVDFRAYCTSKARADAIAAELRKHDRAVTMVSKRTLLIFKGWIVKVCRTRRWSLEMLQSDVEAFARLCERHEVLLDGYGAELPGPGSGP